MFFASLIREERWDLVTELLSEGIFVNNTRKFESGILGFDDVSGNIVLLDHRNTRLQLAS